MKIVGLLFLIIAQFFFSTANANQLEVYTDSDGQHLIMENGGAISVVKRHIIVDSNAKLEFIVKTPSQQHVIRVEREFFTLTSGEEVYKLSTKLFENFEELSRLKPAKYIEVLTNKLKHIGPSVEREWEANLLNAIEQNIEVNNVDSCGSKKELLKKALASTALFASKIQADGEQLAIMTIKAFAVQTIAYKDYISTCKSELNLGKFTTI